MTQPFRDLRYVRIRVDDLQAAATFATEIAGLQPVGEEEGCVFFRSDARAYALAYSSVDAGAVGLSVATAAELDARAQSLSAIGVAVRAIEPQACALRRIKAGVVCAAPNGVAIEIVWRPLTSGWRYHGPRDAGLVDLGAVALGCRDMAANERFWTEGLGCAISDWAGQAAYIRLDAAHHRVALYPSAREGLLGVEFAVEGVDNLMQNFYFLQQRQLPILHGPGRQPASGKMFVWTRGPGGVMLGYSAGARETDAPAPGPRQFPDEPASHCAWGSATREPEFLVHSRIAQAAR